MAQASCLFRTFCHGGKDPQTLAQRNYEETPNAFLLGMVIKNYKRWVMKASGYSSIKQACRLLLWLCRLSTPASCSRLLCCVCTGSFPSPNCSCFFWPQGPQWESQGNGSLAKSMFWPQGRQFRDTVTFRSCYSKQNWIQNLKDTHTHTPYTHAPSEPCFLIF